MSIERIERNESDGVTDSSEPEGRYVETGRARTYCRSSGAGDPVVLLHGGLATAESWQAQEPALAEHYRVLMPEQRGHGRTPDLPGPYSYADMALDTAALLETMDTGPAHLVGWSDGAAVGLQVALQRPDLVRKLVLIGQYLNPDGQVPGAMQVLSEHRDALEAMMRPAYDALSPDGPGHFPVVLEKVLQLWRTEPDLPLERLGSLHAPTLVLQGDRDMVRVEHSAAVAAAIPESQLGVVPGASHGLPIEKPDLVNRMILDFLADEQVPLLMPLPG